MVYVISIEGKPLMPCKPAKARHLLRDGKAKVVKREPFTIQLLFKCENITQPITLGIDAGSKHIGVSASTEKKEVYAADVELRDDIVDLISTRRQNRKSRRNRLRYRKPRFDNRKKGDNWLPPSIEQKVQCHLKVVADLHKILPITKIVVETTAFDMQKLLNPDIEGEEYQQGEQSGFWNAREYVLWRDNHTCQCCKGKSKDSVLEVHHIEGRKIGGNAPNNLVTLCRTCHQKHHREGMLLNIARGKSMRHEAFMNTMRWAFYNRLKEIYPTVKTTYGYITKSKRIAKGLPKEHYIDAYCIAENLNAEPLGNYYYQKKVRCHNRQIHKTNPLRGGRKKLNQAPYNVLGFRLFDKVKMDKVECFIFGRRLSGYFDVRKLDGIRVHKGISYKKLKLIEPRRRYLTERRKAVFLPTL